MKVFTDEAKNIVPEYLHFQAVYTKLYTLYFHIFRWSEGNFHFQNSNNLHYMKIHLSSGPLLELYINLTVHFIWTFIIRSVVMFSTKDITKTYIINNDETTLMKGVLLT